MTFRLIISFSIYQLWFLCIFSFFLLCRGLHHHGREAGDNLDTGTRIYVKNINLHLPVSWSPGCLVWKSSIVISYADERIFSGKEMNNIPITGNTGACSRKQTMKAKCWLWDKFHILTIKKGRVFDQIGMFNMN